MTAPSVLRGLVAGAAAFGFVLTFLFAQTGLVSPSVVLGIALASVAALFAAGGRPAVRRLLGREPATTEPEADADAAASEEVDWWLARVEPALESSWNAWSDWVLTIGLGVLGFGALGLLVTHPGDEPPLGLLVVGFLGINCALISLAFAID
jgi:hypothetical protein